MWENTISLPDLETEDYGEVINMDRFLSENNLLSSELSEETMSVVVSPPHSTSYETGVSTSPREYTEVKDVKVQPRPSIFAHTSGQG